MRREAEAVTQSNTIDQNIQSESETAQTSFTTSNNITTSLFAELVGEALQGSSVWHFRITNNNVKDLISFTKEAKSVVKNKLEEELKRLNFIKFGLVLDAQFVNVENEIRPRAFICRNRSITKTSNIIEGVEECMQELTLKVTEHEARGSGWSLLKVDSITIRVHKHGYGDRGSSYIPLPDTNTHSCINVKNEYNECFRYMLC